MHPGHLVSEHATKWSIEARRRDVLILLARSGLRKLGLWQTTQLRAVETVRGVGGSKAREYGGCLAGDGHIMNNLWYDHAELLLAEPRFMHQSH